MAEVRFLIADDHRLFREGLSMLLKERADFHVAAEAGDGRETLRLVSELKPDVLLLDLDMPKLSGMEVLRQIDRSGGLRIIVLTAAIDSVQIRHAFQLGAHGILMKESATNLLYKCIDSVLAGQVWLIREARPDAASVMDGDQLLKPAKPPKQFGLTRRELEILAAIVAGKTNRELAEQFSISVQTVKHHVTNIFDKVGVFNRLELALFAIHHGLIRKSAVEEQPVK